VDRSKWVLNSFSENLSEAAQNKLKNLGVEVLSERGVDQIDEEGVIVAGERIHGASDAKPSYRRTPVIRLSSLDRRLDSVLAFR
jgi:hypothetical protein